MNSRDCPHSRFRRSVTPQNAATISKLLPKRAQNEKKIKQNQKIETVAILRLAKVFSCHSVTVKVTDANGKVATYPNAHVKISN